MFRRRRHADSIATLVGDVGFTAYLHADYAAALFLESLALLRAIGDRRGVAECLMGLAGVIAARGQPKTAARLFGAAEALREGLGAALWPANRLEYEHNLAALRARLTPGQLEAAWSAGRALSLDAAVAEVLGQSLA